MDEAALGAVPWEGGGVRTKGSWNGWRDPAVKEKSLADAVTRSTCVEKRREHTPRPNTRRKLHAKGGSISSRRLLAHVLPRLPFPSCACLLVGGRVVGLPRLLGCPPPPLLNHVVQGGLLAAGRSRGSGGHGCRVVDLRWDTGWGESAVGRWRGPGDSVGEAGEGRTARRWER